MSAENCRLPILKTFGVRRRVIPILFENLEVLCTLCDTISLVEHGPHIPALHSHAPPWGLEKGGMHRSWSSSSQALELGLYLDQACPMAQEPSVLQLCSLPVTWLGPVSAGWLEQSHSSQHLCCLDACLLQRCLPGQPSARAPAGPYMKTQCS